MKFIPNDIKFKFGRSQIRRENCDIPKYPVRKVRGKKLWLRKAAANWSVPQRVSAALQDNAHDGSKTKPSHSFISLVRDCLEPIDSDEL